VKGSPTRTKPARIAIDEVSLLVEVAGEVPLDELEGALGARGLTLDAPDLSRSVRGWLDAGAPGARDRWLDPADQIVAGLEGTLRDGRTLRIAPAPRRAVGPDLTALVLGCGGRFVTTTRAWLRVHKVGVARPSAPFDAPRDPPLSDAEAELVARIARALAG
jgi:alkyldihydroxyacetonephosphate synthase